MSQPPHSPSSPLHPTTPEIYSRYSPKLVRRMQEDTCFKCQQKGHWKWDCPMNSSNTKPDSPSPDTKPHSPSPDQDSLTSIWCRCGHGYCEVKTARNSRNFGKKYFACPIKRGKKCKDFVKWYDDVEENDKQPPAYKYPECECGAGVCRREEATECSGPVKYYFACPVREEHGSCGYRVWEEELLNNKSISPIQQGRCRTLDEFWCSFGDAKIDNDWGKAGDLLVKHFKRMRLIDSSDSPSSMAVPEAAEREHGAPNADPSKGVSRPEFEIVADELDPDFSWDANEEKALLLSCQSTPSRICYQQIVFQMNIFTGAVADASFGCVRCVCVFYLFFRDMFLPFTVP